MKQENNMFTRSSGILLPVSSLPSKYGIGDFGCEARRWIDFLCNARQSYWQILPLSPTSYGDSPYQSFSAFAGNPYFIDLDALHDDGLLETNEYTGIKWSGSDKKADYALLYSNREPVLRKAFSRFTDRAALDHFIEQNHWFREYGLYMVIKAMQDHRSWLEWDEPLRTRQPDAIGKIKSEHSEDIYYHAFVQYQFDKQWNALREYAVSKSIRIIGDIPIYVSMDSADVWACTELFQLDDDLTPKEISGCPPDSFAADGQVWGNPLYNWETIAATGYKWWIERMRKCFELYDVVRLDHFRGLESYFAIPYGDETAVNGSWRTGPGKGFIDAIKNAIPGARIIAEDLGYLTEEVYELLQYSGYPGMKLTQYAFDYREAGDYIPYNYERNTVVYPGTHDNDTLKGWSVSAPERCIEHAMEYMGITDSKDLTEAMIRLTLECSSDLAVIPMQDWLGLGGGARFNVPSTVGGNNWRWRLGAEEVTDELADRIARMTHLYGRSAAENEACQ